MKRLLIAITAILTLGTLDVNATNLVPSAPEEKSADKKGVEAYINLDKFHEIVVDFVGNIKFVQSSESRIEASGPERIIRHTNADVSDGVLNIYFDEGAQIKMRKGEKLQLTIYSPTLTRINLRGVSDLKASGTVNTPAIEILNDGVGNISFADLQCKKLTVVSNGVGNISLKGTTDSASYKSDGVGSINAYEMISKVTVVSLNGVGGVQCYASEQCDLVNNGIGNIHYKGTPAVERIQKNGIGSISRK